MKTVDFFQKTIAASDLKGSRSRHLIEFMKVCEGQGHFFTIYLPGFVCFVLYWAKISGERLQGHWSSGYYYYHYYYYLCMNKNNKVVLSFHSFIPTFRWHDGHLFQGL